MIQLDNKTFTACKNINFSNLNKHNELKRIDSYWCICNTGRAIEINYPRYFNPWYFLTILRNKISFKNSIWKFFMYELPQAILWRMRLNYSNKFSKNYSLTDSINTECDLNARINLQFSKNYLVSSTKFDLYKLLYEILMPSLFLYYLIRSKYWRRDIQSTFLARIYHLKITWESHIFDRRAKWKANVCRHNII